MYATPKIEERVVGFAPGGLGLGPNGGSVANTSNTDRIIEAINKSKDGWRTARGIANELDLSVDFVKIILEKNRRFIYADALNTRFYSTKEKYFRWTNFMHIFSDFFSQKVTI